METKKQIRKVSKMADGLVGSEIIKLAGEIKAKIAGGEKIYNLTIGDFDPTIFSIPDELKKEIIQAYQDNETNYPASNGIQELRDSVSSFVSHTQGLDYSSDEYLISGGARPLIYGCYQAIVDPTDSVLFPVPSWNNNHYTHLVGAKKVFIETTAENNFMPSASDFEEHISSAGLIAVCSPLNPTGTVFSEEQLAGICALILKENQQRLIDGRKPVYLMYDQIYSQLTHGDIKHINPVSLYPEMRPYTIFIDGISKYLAATGVRVGWAFGPSEVIQKMKSILGHIGAWSPKAEQVATAKYLSNYTNVEAYLHTFKSDIHYRLESIHQGIVALREKGYSVNVIHPQAAIYLSVQFNLKGLTTEQGKTLENTKDITKYLLEEAKLAIVPFYAFGTDESSTWYRISVGTLKKEDIPQMLHQLEAALEKLR